MPIVILLLGASSPNTEDGTITGNAQTAPAANPLRKKARLDNPSYLLAIVPFRVKM
jgi:hypothetical protein